MSTGSLHDRLRRLRRASDLAKLRDFAAPFLAAIATGTQDPAEER